MSGNSGHSHTTIGFGTPPDTNGAIGFSNMAQTAAPASAAAAAEQPVVSSATQPEAKGGRMGRKQTTPKKRKQAPDGKSSTPQPQPQTATSPSSKKPKQALANADSSAATNDALLKDDSGPPAAVAQTPSVAPSIIPPQSTSSQSAVPLPSIPEAETRSPARSGPSPTTAPLLSPRATPAPSSVKSLAFTGNHISSPPVPATLESPLSPPPNPESALSGKAKPAATLQSFFMSSGSASGKRKSLPPAVAATTASATASSASPQPAALPAANAQLVDEIKRLKGLVAKSEAENKRLASELEQQRNYLSPMAVDAHLNEFRSKTNRLLIEILRENARRERHERDEQMLRDTQRVGRVASMRDGLSEIWEDGEAYKALKRQKEALQIASEEVAAAHKAAQQAAQKKKSKARRDAKKSAATPASAAAAAGHAGSDDEDEASEAQEEAHSLDTGGFVKPRAPGRNTSLVDESSRIVEMLSTRLEILERDKKELAKQEAALEQEKKRVIRNQRLIADERASKWNHMPILPESRYLLLNLLGRGGFSEVWKAFDLRDYKYVACKIHHLDSRWDNERKRNYTRHATREYNIHCALKHKNVVQLFDVIGIDESAFCTVLEFCDGYDLDMYLKNRHTLTEKEARAYIMQVLEGLKYLSEQKQAIIHYDLKPGNILFDKGEVKITDFGLSKQMEEDTSETELTSQGAGTYWYLPPECFHMGQATSTKISPKVDIWSTGIILYQMLYGKKPFGHGMSPELLISNRTMSLASGSTVEFPAHPRVSEACQAFIRRCLDVNPKLRPSIHEIFQDPYFAAPKNVTTKV